MFWKKNAPPSPDPKPPPAGEAAGGVSVAQGETRVPNERELDSAIDTVVVMLPPLTALSCVHAPPPTGADIVAERLLLEAKRSSPSPACAAAGRVTR